MIKCVLHVGMERCTQNESTYILNEKKFEGYKTISPGLSPPPIASWRAYRCVPGGQSRDSYPVNAAAHVYETDNADESLCDRCCAHTPHHFLRRVCCHNACQRCHSAQGSCDDVKTDDARETARQPFLIGMSNAPALIEQMRVCV